MERRAGNRRRPGVQSVGVPTPAPLRPTGHAVATSPASASTPLLTARAAELIAADANAQPIDLFKETLAAPEAVVAAWNNAIAMRGGELRGERDDELDRQADLVDALLARVAALERALADRDVWLRDLVARQQQTERRLADGRAEIEQLRARLKSVDDTATVALVMADSRR